MAFPSRQKRGFDPRSREPFRLSRSKIELFLECPRCFYLDQRLSVRRPDTYPLTLNNAVDELLKREFDIHRAAGSRHPLMKRYGVDAVPYADKRLDEWRDSLRRGIAYRHEPSGLIVRGGVDDVWVNPKGELIVVDYKATSKKTKISIDAEWQRSYKRQMEIYQWLFRKNGFAVSDTGYFVYVNGRSDAEAFDGKLEFDVSLIPYTGSHGWIEPTLVEIRKCLAADAIPPSGERCEYCPYREAAGKALLAMHAKGRGRERRA